MTLEAKCQLLEAKEEIVKTLKEKLADGPKPQMTVSCAQNGDEGDLTSDRTAAETQAKMQRITELYEGKINILNEEIADLEKTRDQGVNRLRRLINCDITIVNFSMIEEH